MRSASDAGKGDVTMDTQVIVVAVVVIAAVMVAIVRMARLIRSKDAPDCGCGRGRDCAKKRAKNCENVNK